jgi:hypothetical protein
MAAIDSIQCHTDRFCGDRGLKSHAIDGSIQLGNK